MKQFDRGYLQIASYSMTFMSLLDIANPTWGALNDPVASDGTVLIVVPEATVEVASARSRKVTTSPSFTGDPALQNSDLPTLGVTMYGSDGTLPDYILQEEKNSVSTSPFGSRVLPRTIIGQDYRQQLRSTNFPAKAVVYITFKSGAQSGVCTGWMIGKDTVATAGHCVHSGGSTGEWYQNHVAYPGRDRRRAPYGSCKATRTWSVNGWIEERNPEYDYGALKLNCDVGNRTGWFGFYWQRDFLNEPVAVQGYPGDKPSGTQWLDVDKNRCNSTRKVFYKLDTFGGMSGGPIWNSTAHDGAYAMGIHTNGAPSYGCNGTYNSGVRITEGVFDNLKAWIDSAK
ncbi:MAG: serine protease [Candidatus Competibacteraceae bacterium]|nr:serine protease [Candidatus Competibacteraceae bacterium]